MPVGLILSLFGGIKEDISQEIVSRNKGKSLIEFPKDYTVIDIETTGLDSGYDEIIELSAIKIRNNEIVDKYSTLVKPDDEIDDFISELTGITNEMLKNAPKINKVIKDYISFIGDDVLVGYNVNFDVNFIYDALKNDCDKEFSNNFVDVMRICKKQCDLPNHKLKTVAKHYNVSIDGHHRGLNDCHITNDVYVAVVNEILKNYESAKDFYSKNWYNNHNLSKDINRNENADTSNFFYNKTCVFTGELKIPRKDAMNCVAQLGAFVADTLTQKTNILIVGTQDYKKTKENGKSNKMLKAEKYILKGQDLIILSESQFFELLNEQ